MTFVGKILVILIMAFSLVFLGVSTVVFSTAANWKEKSGDQAKQISKLQGDLKVAKDRAADADSKLKGAREEHDKQIKERENRIAELEKATKDAENEMAQARGQLETAQQTAKTALAEATTRKGEIDVLNETLGKAQTQANQFSTQNIELTDQIRVLQREKATAEQNSKDLRTFVGRMTAFMRGKGLNPDNLDKFDPNSVPPAVEGKVVELNATRRSMEISIGSDDGLQVGQEFYVFRTQPRAEYIGKVKIVSVYPDQAVAEVIGNTVNGKKIQEGDIVSSTFSSTR